MTGGLVDSRSALGNKDVVLIVTVKSYNDRKLCYCFCEEKGNFVYLMQLCNTANSLLTFYYSYNI